MVRTRFLTLVALLVSMGLGSPTRGDSGRVVSRTAEPPVTADGIQALEGTDTVPSKAWHARQSLTYQYNFATADRASQFRLSQSFGVGLPGRLELGLSFPIGWTIGSKAPAGTNPAPRTLAGMDDDGFGIGDVSPYLLFSALRAGEKGLGLMFGVKGSVPTGDNEKLMGEGGFTVEPTAAFAFQIFGSRLAVNLAYRVRPEHLATVHGKTFEQDDDLIWRVGVRIPRKKDVAWSIEAEGMIGMLTSEGVWPSSNSRPVWLGGGLDFPVGRLHRLALGVGFGLSGKTVPSFTLGIALLWQPVLPDEDKDGVSGASDRCSLLKEDLDGFEDDDGCPDLDNDQDGFPDDEDKCPLQPADNFSEDGC